MEIGGNDTHMQQPQLLFSNDHISLYIIIIIIIPLEAFQISFLYGSIFNGRILVYFMGGKL